MDDLLIKPIHNVYANVIIAGNRSFNSVLNRDKGAVRQALYNKGYEIDENGLVTKLRNE